MRIIPPDEAEKNYGITTKHTEQDNKQLRFRLLKVDGSSYIRTEAPTDYEFPEEQWQKAHYHKKLTETYIVQSGWIIYLEYVENRARFYEYHAGELFTILPNIHHNIYLPPKAVIHTVKHGDVTVNDWYEDEIFTKITKRFVGDILNLIAIRPSVKENYTKDAGKVELNLRYNPEYRHFDNLIWQVPVWSTAIFTVVLAGMARLTTDGALMKFIGLSLDMFFALVYGIFWIFLMCYLTHYIVLDGIKFNAKLSHQVDSPHSFCCN